MRRLFGIGCLASALAISVGFLPQPALAASRIIRIGTGTPASCTETAFINALATARARHGATIRFRCGRAPVVIPVSDALTIPTNTTIDGDGLITLQGGDGTFAVLLVDAGTTVTLRGLTITNPDGGFGVINDGQLLVSHTVFDDNTGVCGSALDNEGTLTVRHSRFTNGFGFFSGGAICNRGTATIEFSFFSENGGGGSANGGGAIHNLGTLTVANSIFAHNTSFHDPGGAIRSNGTLSIRNTIFFQNDGGQGGAVFIDAGAATITNSVLLENAATGAAFSLAEGHGGGIYNHGGELRVTNSVIEGNTAVAPGGGIFTCCDGSTSLQHALVIGNLPDDVVP
jgi:predicted outer membrane repeat protein